MLSYKCSEMSVAFSALHDFLFMLYIECQRTKLLEESRGIDPHPAHRRATRLAGGGSHHSTLLSKSGVLPLHYQPEGQVGFEPTLPEVTLSGLEPEWDYSRSFSNYCVYQLRHRAIKKNSVEVTGFEPANSRFQGGPV